MKILFIQPGVGKKKKYIKTWQMEPLMIAQLAALTPPGVQVKFFDDRIEEIDFNEPADLVAVTVETYTAKRAYEISNRFRTRGIHVVLGGYHPTLVPEEAKEHADSIVIGEAEDTWPELISDAESGRLKKVYEMPLTRYPEGLMPDRSIYKTKKYIPIRLIESARGCRFDCRFCSVTQFFNHTYKPRLVEDVIEDIHRGGKKKIFFVDDNIVTDINRTKNLLRALIPLKIQWAGQGIISLADDPELLMLLKRSGCRVLLIGFESLDKETLGKMNKSWNRSPEYYEESIRKIHKAGIGIYATFVFGLGNEDEQTFEETFNFARRNRFLFAGFNHLVPFPGTPVYNELKGSGRLLFEQWWLKDGYNYGEICFKPERLSPENLSRLCVNTRRRFFSLGSILYRALNFRANLQSIPFSVIYFGQNLLQRKEVEMKYGMPLGSGFDK
ncbi:MAG TPA: B12-binding domain-containing radical SAM protein [Firmicutes bacterium]|nr:B12-binding domain-containing radical SAM protein [Bacillota bacterium]